MLGCEVGCEERLHDADASMVGNLDVSSGEDLALLETKVQMDKLDPHPIGEIVLVEQVLEVGRQCRPSWLRERRRLGGC